MVTTAVVAAFTEAYAMFFSDLVEGGFVGEYFVGDYILWSNTPWVQASLGLVFLLAFALLIRLLIERALTKIVHRFLKRRPKYVWLLKNSLLSHLATLSAPLVVQAGLPYVPNLPFSLYQIIYNVAVATTALFVVLALNALIDACLNFYMSSERGRLRSVKSYVQLSKLVIFVVGLIVMTAALIDRSPLILLSGLGAMSAVLLVVFKDTIVAFVSSFQLTANGMLAVGDWIEMPQYGADGRVIEIALQTVRVQNWDNTVTMIPTARLMNESFKNRRAMLLSGQWRIKRALCIDADAIVFLDDDDLKRLSRKKLLTDEFQRKIEDEGIRSRPTNLGAFRDYARAYLAYYPGIRPDKPCLARLLESESEGVPVEIYAFVGTSRWIDFETTQSDIFDHLLAILPAFGLSLYQKSSSQAVRLSKAAPVADPSKEP